LVGDGEDKPSAARRGKILKFGGGMLESGRHIAITNKGN
jgi:hypothetical protein